MTYPMHDKLKPIAHQSQVIGEFIEWCADHKGWFFATYDDNYRGGHEAIRVAVDIAGVLAEFFDIDLAVLEEEKRAMLRTIRETAEGVT